MKSLSPRHRKTIKIPNPQRLANIALHYLSRYAASEASLRRVLLNRIRRAVMRDPAFAADHEKHKELHNVIETIIEKHRKTGAINDAAYAETKVNSLRRAGRSHRAIQQKLSLKGVSKSIIEKSLAPDGDELDVESLEIKAALTLARRRRLGPYRSGPTDIDRHRKDVAAMARAGFALTIIRKVLGGDCGEEEHF